MPDLALLRATEMMNVSWKVACQHGAEDGTEECQRCHPLPKRWQNPMECLSLTLEEVIHIRSVLTKAELESLVSHPALYSQVSKSKVCFTCKTTRFTLFGEWGTKCKFCKRTVCSKCMRKIHVPPGQYRNIPVYTLITTPLTSEAHALIQSYIKSGIASLPSSPRVSGSTSSLGHSSPRQQRQKGKHSLQRSHSLTLHTKKPSSSDRGVAGAQSGRGPLVSICCDCKGMIMEILRASKSSLAMLQSAAQSTGHSPLSSPSSSTSSSSQSSTSSSY